ncbi:MAG: oxidase [Terracidiphilus sp.]|jgi:caa(3)-type oxidase subunit IV
MSEQNTHAHPVGNPMIDFVVYLALLAGVGLQILASYHNLGIFNPILAVSIAVMQASLVALFPMHLKYGSKLNMLSVGSCIFLFMILIGMVFMDCYSRAWGSW